MLLLVALRFYFFTALRFAFVFNNIRFLSSTLSAWGYALLFLFFFFVFTYPLHCELQMWVFMRSLRYKFVLLSPHPLCVPLAPSTLL